MGFKPIVVGFLLLKLLLKVVSDKVLDAELVMFVRPFMHIRRKFRSTQTRLQILPHGIIATLNEMLALSEGNDLLVVAASVGA